MALGEELVGVAALPLVLHSVLMMVSMTLLKIQAVLLRYFVVVVIVVDVDVVADVVTADVVVVDLAIDSGSPSPLFCCCCCSSC